MGGHVIPIQFDLEKEEIFKLMDKCNGVLFTGGGGGLYDFVDNQKVLKPHIQTAQVMIQYADTLNQQGWHFPIFSICLGIQIMA